MRMPRTRQRIHTWNPRQADKHKQWLDQEKKLDDQADKKWKEEKPWKELPHW